MIGHDLQTATIRFSGEDAPTPAWKGRLAGADPMRAAERRVAIVEDELMVAWSLECTVEELGYAVAGIFANAEAALASLLSDPVDLVLMDINLGRGIDGVEAAARLRSAHDVGIVFISAYADATTRARIGSAVPGALFLPKPVQSADLAAILERVFRTAH